jgi:hypothetical protein
MPSVYQLRVVLREVSPLIWRRLLVRSDTPVAELHAILQAVMSWSDSHLHRFRIHGKAYGIARLGGISFGDDPFEVRLCDFRLHRGEQFFYEYDFSDGWVLGVRLERSLPIDPTGVYPRCTAGRRAAPPEDCGGPWAYLAELDRHQLPPWEALEQVAAAARRFLDTGDRVILEEEDEFAEAIDCLEAYARLRPEYFDRKAINSQLQGLAKSAGGAA